MKSILDPTFRYIPSHETDVRKTFERIRRAASAATPAAKRKLLLIIPLPRAGTPSRRSR